MTSQWIFLCGRQSYAGCLCVYATCSRMCVRLCKCKKNLHLSIMQVGEEKGLTEKQEKMTLVCVYKIISIH